MWGWSGKPFPGVKSLTIGPSACCVFTLYVPVSVFSAPRKRDSHLGHATLTAARTLNIFSRGMGSEPGGCIVHAPAAYVALLPSARPCANGRSVLSTTTSAGGILPPHCV